MKYPHEPIQMLWIGDNISLLEHLCMQSFLSNGHPVHLYTYGDVDNVPEGVVFFDAEELINKEHVFIHKGSYAALSDLFRWKLLVEKGGYYCDTDVLCIKPFNFSDDAIIGMETHNSYNAAITKFPKQHPLCLEMLHAAENPLQIKPYDTYKIKKKRILRKILFTTKAIGWGETAGPAALSRAIKHFKLDDVISIKDFTYFYPISAGNWDSLFNDTLTHETLFDNTHAIHLWNEMIRRADMDKNKPFHEDSLVGKYYTKYCTNK